MKQFKIATCNLTNQDVVIELNKKTEKGLLGQYYMHHQPFYIINAIQAFIQNNCQE